MNVAQFVSAFISWWHLNCFQFGDILTTAAMNVCIRFSCGLVCKFLLDKNLRGKLLSCRVSVCLTFEETASFPMWLQHLCISTSNMWIVNFRMFKLVLEKAEESEIKLPPSAGSSKKQESSRKHPFLLYFHSCCYLNSFEYSGLSVAVACCQSTFYNCCVAVTVITDLYTRWKRKKKRVVI